MEFCLVYISSSRELSANDLNELSLRSQENNRSLGITGILLYCNGSIIQALEGEEDKVNALYQVIVRDTRHAQVTKLFSGSIDKRSFGDWLMGYRTLKETEMDHLKSEISFIQDPYTNVKHSNVVMSLVQTFYKNNHRN